MRTLRYRLRVDLRRGFASYLVIALLVGVTGGVALASVAAARRTDTAFARMRRATDAWDVLVNPNNGAESKLDPASIRRLPGVERVGRMDGIVLYPSFAPSLSAAFNLAPIFVADANATRTIGRPVVTAGRAPDAADPDAVLAERSFARQMHLHVGDSFHYVIMTPALLQAMQDSGSLAAAKAVLRAAPTSLRGTAHIAGIGVGQDGVVVNQGYVPSGLVFTPAFRAAHPELQVAYWGAMVKLRPGTDVDAFTRRVQALVPDESIAFQHASAVAVEVREATDPDVLALYLFAAMVAFLGIVVVFQALSRRLQVDATSNETWAALGTTRWQRMVASWAKAGIAVALGAMLAVGVAIAASPLGPVGVVRVIEPDPGIATDWIVLGLGAAAILVVGLLVAAWPAWRWARVRDDRRARHGSRVAGAAAAAGGSMAAVVGLRFALERPAGRDGVPVRATFVAATTAVALITAVVVFSGSLDHLLSTPRLFGSAWDAQIELDNLNTPAGIGDAGTTTMDQIESQFMHVADRSGAIAASAVVPLGEVRSGATTIPAIGFARRMGDITPTIAAGRAPASAREVALGSTTMAQLDTHIGATVRLARTSDGRRVPVRVVGRAVLPGLAPYSGSDKAGLGTGALLTVAGVRAYSPDFQKDEYVFRWAHGGSVGSLTRAFRRGMPSQLPLTVNSVNHPAGIVSAQRLQSTPTFLALLVVALLATAVTNALVVTVRRRRRDLAMLRTLGCTTGQMVRTVLWQASTIGVVAVVIGIPVGLVVGRLGWNLLADRLGAIAVPSPSAVALIGVAVAAPLLAGLAGLVPGLRATRRAPAAALRVE
jgi:putative ABC transport system permease protein